MSSTREENQGPDPQPPETAADPSVFDWRTFDLVMLQGGMNSPLARELITFRDHLDEMLKDHNGEYVMIQGERIVSYHSSRKNALKAVFQDFGRAQVLIKQVLDKEPIRRVGLVNENR